MENTQKLIYELEELIGFPIQRNEITLESKSPHDETFSYNLCLKFYNDKEGLKRAIHKTEYITLVLLKTQISPPKEIALFFSLLGDMYYLSDNFEKSLGCFMKSLSYNKVDITNWAGLMFSLRALGKFGIFEKIRFNLDFFVNSWKNSNEKEFNQDVLLSLIEKLGF